jgi:two-component system osmolarity sensor histidine kinase EnvZ
MLRMIKLFMPRSLFGRALLIIVSPLILLQIVSTYIFYQTHWENVSWRLALGVAGDMAFTAGVLERDPDDQARARMLAIAQRSTAASSLYFQPGEILPNAPPDESQTVLGKRLERAMAERVRRPARIDDVSDDRQVLIAVQLPDGVLHAAVSRKRVFSSTTYVFIIWMIGTSLILFGVAGLFMRNQVRPIRRLAEAASRFGKGQEVQSFKLEGATEVRQAAIEFNRMRERITRAIMQRTEMLAGVSHDLRTPLTRMKLQLALLPPSPDVAALKTDIADMERMLEAYLAFVRGEGAEPTVESELRPLLEEVVGGARRDGGEVELAIEGDIRLAFKPNAIRRTLTNLVANACRYGQHVAVRARRLGNSLELIVDDDGPGIPSDRREDVFRPFFRLDSSRNVATGGVGLGLTIARDLVRGHGGDLVLDQSPQGGLRAIVRLPL